MTTERDGAELQNRNREERRDPHRANERTHLKPEEMAVLIRERRFEGQRPADLEAEQFSSPALKTAVRKLFDRLDGRLDFEKVEQWKAGFERSVAIWEQAGLFTEERTQAGHLKPDFDRDYLPLLTDEILSMMEGGEALDRGYDAPVWSPVDLPLHSEDAEQPSYFKVLEAALLEAYNGTAGGKKPQTLLIGPEKRVIGQGQINLEEILWRWERYLKEGVVHNAKELDPKNHEGIAEAKVLEGLQGVEKQNGGVMRLERTQLVMPRDVEKETMSAQDWGKLLASEGSPLPKKASVQDIKQAMAFVIYCLATQGWIPDFFDWDDINIKNPRVALALGTYIPDNKLAGAVAALYWSVLDRQFYMSGNGADDQRSFNGVRPGVRMG